MIAGKLLDNLAKKLYGQDKPFDTRDCWRLPACRTARFDAQLDTGRLGINKDTERFFCTFI